MGFEGVEKDVQRSMAGGWWVPHLQGAMAHRSAHSVTLIVTGRKGLSNSQQIVLTAPQSCACVLRASVLVQVRGRGRLGLGLEGVEQQ